jgi:hypothetical protein
MADETQISGAGDGGSQTILGGSGEVSRQQQFTPTFEGALKPDGSFAEGWHAKAFGADYSGPLAQAKNFSDVEKMLRDNIAAARAKTEGMVRLPGANAKPEEWAAYRKAIGAPDTPDAYGDLRPETIPAEMWDAEGAKALQAVAHKHALPPAAIKDILGLYAGQIDVQMQKGQADMAEHVAGQTAILKQEWGADFDANARQATRFALTIGLKPDNPIFQNAEVVRAMAQGAKLLSEDKLINGATMGLTASPQEQAKAIMTDPSNPHYKAYQAGEASAVALVHNLLQQK